MWVYDKPADDGYRSTYMMLRHENQIKFFSRNSVDIYNCLAREIRHLYKNNFKVEIHNTYPTTFRRNDYIDLSVLTC